MVSHHDVDWMGDLLIISRPLLPSKIRDLGHDHGINGIIAVKFILNRSSGHYVIQGKQSARLQMGRYVIYDYRIHFSTKGYHGI